MDCQHNHRQFVVLCLIICISLGLSCVVLLFLSLVRMLREELQLLQEQGSYVGEVVKAMDKKKVLVKVDSLPYAS